MTPEIEKRIKAVKAGRVPAGYKKSAGGIVPVDWNEIPLGNCICEYKEKTTKANQYPMLTSARIGLMLQSEYYSGHQVTTDDNVGYNVLPRGYITFRSRSDDGRFKFNENNVIDKGIISYFYPVFSFAENVVHVFMLQLLNETIYRQMFPYNEGTAQMVLSFNKLKSLIYNIPSLSEQKKIAEILSAQDKIIEFKEKLIAERQRQKKYLMQLLLGEKTKKKKFTLNSVVIDKTCWKKTKLKNLCKDIIAGATPSTKNIKYWNGDIPWMSSGEINKKVVYDTNVKITQLGYDSCSTKLVPAKCVLIALAGQGKTRGSVAINEISLCTNQSLATIIPKNIDYKYLFYYLDSKYLDLRTISSGDGQRGGLNLDIISNYEVLLPSLPEQQAIASVLSSADEEISLLQRDLEQEKLKKKSLMQLLLTGLVRV